MPDRLICATNDTVAGGGPAGYNYDEEVFVFGLASEASALTGSAQFIPVAIAKNSGRIVDLIIAVAAPAVSASGFVSANVSATVRINSVTAMSTNPSVAGPVGSAGQATRKATNAGGGVSGVVNVASCSFRPGDVITVDYNLQSAGSAAAGTAGSGFVGMVVVRYGAR